MRISRKPRSFQPGPEPISTPDAEGKRILPIVDPPLQPPLKSAKYAIQKIKNKQQQQCRRQNTQQHQPNQDRYPEPPSNQPATPTEQLRKQPRHRKRRFKHPVSIPQMPQLVRQ